MYYQWRICVGINTAINRQNTPIRLNRLQGHAHKYEIAKIQVDVKHTHTHSPHICLFLDCWETGIRCFNHLVPGRSLLWLILCICTNAVYQRWQYLSLCLTDTRSQRERALAQANPDKDRLRVLWHHQTVTGFWFRKPASDWSFTLMVPKDQ